MNILDRMRKKIKAPSRGQSLVEMAVIMPILIFMMIGVFEVGWVLRSYLVLANGNRELARFAIRPGTLDFSTNDPQEIGYDLIMKRVSTISGEVDIDLKTNSALIISHLVADTGLPCRREVLEDDVVNGNENCKCDDFLSDSPPETFTYDDIILHPDVPGYDHFSQAYPTSTITASTYVTNVTNIDYTTEISDMVKRNNKLNCEFVKKQDLSGTAPLETSPNNVIIVEIAMEQPQLFGFPVISNPLTDPILLYSQTTMRLVAGARSASGTQSLVLVGRICNAYPWYVSESRLQDIVNDVDGDGEENGNFFEGWVRWGDPQYGESEEEYVQYSVGYPQMAMNQFQNGASPIAKGQDVMAKDVTVANTDVISNIQAIVEALQGRNIVVPVLADGSNTIANFIAVEIGTEDTDVDIQNGIINGLYLESVADGESDDHCLTQWPLP